MPLRHEASHGRSCSRLCSITLLSRDLVLWALRVDLGKAAEGSSAPHAGIGGAVDGGRLLVFCRQ